MLAGAWRARAGAAEERGYPPPEGHGGREERRRGAPPNAVSGGPGAGPAPGRKGGLAAGPSALLPPSAAAARRVEPERQLPGRKGEAEAAGGGRPASSPGSRRSSAGESPGEARAGCEEQRVGADREASLRRGGAILQYGRKAVARAILHLNERPEEPHYFSPPGRRHFRLRQNSISLAQPHRAPPFWLTNKTATRRGPHPLPSSL